MALFADFPYEALGSELAIPTGICAGLAALQAFPAIADLHFLAFYVSLTISMEKAFHTTVTVLRKKQVSLE